jgi:hypothetical protein
MTDKNNNMRFLCMGNSVHLIPDKACLQTMRYAPGGA